MIDIRQHPPFPVLGKDHRIHGRHVTHQDPFGSPHPRKVDASIGGDGPRVGTFRTHIYIAVVFKDERERQVERLDQHWTEFSYRGSSYFQYRDMTFPGLVTELFDEAECAVCANIQERVSPKSPRRRPKRAPGWQFSLFPGLIEYRDAPTLLQSDEPEECYFRQTTGHLYEVGNTLVISGECDFR